jgi:hypothetical protein
MQVGVQLYSESSKPTANADGVGGAGLFVGVVFTNIGPIAPSCVSIPGVLEDSALNLGDPLLTVATGPSGITPFTDGDPAAVATTNADVDWDGNGSADDGVYNGNLLPVGAAAGLVGAQLKFQAFTANAITSAAVGSNVFTTVFSAT